MNYFDEGKNADDNFNNNDIENTENQGTDSIRDVSDNDIPDKDKYNNNSENDTDNGCETGEYEYGISYSSSGVEDNTGNLKAPKNSTKARKKKGVDEIGRKFALVALTLAAVLLLNMFSAMLYLVLILRKSIIPMSFSSGCARSSVRRDVRKRLRSSYVPN